MAIDYCSKDVGANLVANCNSLPKAGVESVGILINRSDIDSYTVDATNPRLVEGITLVAGAITYAIYNPAVKPFEGTGSELSLDTAYPTITKNVMLQIPNIGGAASDTILEPLMKNRDGFILILQRKTQDADGGFIIIGKETGAVASAGSQVMTDDAVNGMYSITMTETGCQFAEVTLTGNTYADAKTTFDALLALAS